MYRGRSLPRARATRSRAERRALLQLLPVLRRHVVRDLERAVRAAVHGLFDADHLAGAESVAHRFLDREVEPLDLTPAAREQDAVLQTILELRVEGRDELR